MKKLRIIIAFLIAPLAAPILACITIGLLSFDNLSGLFMVQWIVFVLLAPFSYMATFFFGILASTVLNELVLKNKKTLLLSGAVFGMMTMFVLCYLTPFFSRNILFVLAGSAFGLGDSYSFSLISGIPIKATSYTTSIATQSSKEKE